MCDAWCWARTIQWCTNMCSSKPAGTQHLTVPALPTILGPSLPVRRAAAPTLDPATGVVITHPGKPFKLPCSTGHTALGPLRGAGHDALCVKTRVLTHWFASCRHATCWNMRHVSGTRCGLKTGQVQSPVAVHECPNAGLVNSGRLPPALLPSSPPCPSAKPLQAAIAWCSHTRVRCPTCHARQHSPAEDRIDCQHPCSVACSETVCLVSLC